MDYPIKSLYHSVELKGCCDGLVCLWLGCHEFNYKSSFCLWNPTTKEYNELPQSPNANPYHNYFSMIGLGYDSKSEDYNLVTGNNRAAEVYSLKFNSWRSIENAPYVSQSRVVGILVNGDIHWLAQPQDYSQVLVSLGIGDQIFKEIQLPNEYSDYGVRESWIERYIINDERIMLSHLMWSFKSGELLFGTYSSDEIAIIYDPINESVKELNMPSLVQFDQEGRYYEILVSLGSGTYVGGEEEGKSVKEKEKE
ncbi:F-box/kelch-repeat protein At3g06240-like [Papaver somniferum]|uniref:F-box/kelch-repeat protein At3g06240-like n=1 Tax=Papaver somniferum TaxID=3469 RepID=UPI000E701F31|nr:F-box/kelch-repeat protein At3g06240-like [Papaver somniferum]